MNYTRLYFIATAAAIAGLLFGYDAGMPAAILFMFALALPESPRWLMLKGKITQAKTILQGIHGPVKAQQEFEEITQVLQQEQLSFTAILRSRFIKIIGLGIIVSIFTQAVGINAIIYYAPTIFQKTGFSAAAVSILATMGIGLTVTLAAVVAALFLDKVGRRKLLLSGLTGIIASLIVITYAFHSIQDQTLLGWVVLLSSIFFVAFWGGKLWTQSYFVETIGNANEEVIREYVSKQLENMDQEEKKYKQLHLF